jgi:hypothetical protein
VLRAWQGEFVSIRIQFRQTQTAEQNARFREKGIREASGVTDWIWEDSGRFRIDSSTVNDGRNLPKSLRLADRQRVYILNFTEQSGNEFPAAAVIRENSLQNTATGANYAALCYWNESNRTWLSQGIQTVSESTVDDDGLLVVSGALIGYPTYELHLDPAHSYLPRSGGSPDGIDHFEVEEFREVEPGFWFPWRGYQKMWGDDMRINWEVLSVELNAELPDELFKPPFGDSTFVIDAITGKQYYHGGRPPVRTAPITEPVPSPPVGTDPALAEREETGDWSWELVIVGILLIAAGVWFQRRR